MPPKKDVSPAGEDKPDLVEELATEVADEVIAYPEGAPEFIPVLKLPRMRRADAYEALGLIQAQQREVKTVEKTDDESTDEPTSDGDEVPEVKPVELDPLSYGAQYRVIAYIEQYLGVVAADPKAFATWAVEVPDAELVRCFNVHVRKAQPGEAESSTG